MKLSCYRSLRQVFPGKMNSFVVLLVFVPSARSIVHDLHRDSYMSAYLDSQGSTEPPSGVIYAEPMRTYGSPQPKPFINYGPPPVHNSPLVPTIPTDHHLYSQEYSYAPIIDILTKLPDKLEFLPKLIAGFLGITKIMLKVVLLKMILKFIVVFCLFFFLPKLEMLDMTTNTETTNTASTSSNNTGPHTPVEELEESRLNNITNFVLNSVEDRSFLKRYCPPNRIKTLKCKIMKKFVEIENYATVHQ